jgi:non-ribosomal peptide synthetase component F
MLVNNAEFRKEEVEQSIPDRFERIVRQYPDRIAIKTRDRDLTYADLNATANCLARAILAKQIKREEPVMLLFEHGPQAVAGILGALKAGTCYVPLDPSLPRESVESIAKDS